MRVKTKHLKTAWWWVKIAAPLILAALSLYGLRSSALQILQGVSFGDNMILSIGFVKLSGSGFIALIASYTGDKVYRPLFESDQDEEEFEE